MTNEQRKTLDFLGSDQDIVSVTEFPDGEMIVETEEMVVESHQYILDKFGKFVG